MELNELLKQLDLLREENKAFFLKVYFANENEYVIKCIDENGNKIKTIRKSVNRKMKAFDIKKEK